MNKFHGTGVAMVTPFHADGTVDYNSLAKLIEHLISGGIEYLVTLGTTGETATLTKKEKQQILDFTVKAVAKRVPLVVGAGGNNTREIIEDLQHLDANAFDAVLSVSPYYNKPTQEGIYQHYKAIAGQSPLPVLLYNVPGRTGSNISAETTLRLAYEFKNIIGIKEASGNFDQFNRILKDKPTDFMFISGDDPVTLPMVALGAVGVISVIGNALPSVFSEMVRNCLKGNYEEARKAHFSLIDLTAMLFEEGNPAGVKSALKSLNICEQHVRLPLVPATEKLTKAIDSSIKSILI